EWELVDSLRSTKGTFFLNKDDAHLSKRMKRVRGLKTSSFGFRARTPDVRGTILDSDERGCARVRIRSRAGRPFEFSLAVPGELNARNALAAASIGIGMKVPAANITRALENLQRWENGRKSSGSTGLPC
ncbi:MAG TPA: Mur ligase family protein, partial [Terriglobia bacterium]|nr:Mur ligase family protein [Terriglobia bacterium]